MRGSHPRTLRLPTITITATALGILFLLAGPAAAQEPDSIFAAARSAIVANRVEKTKALGGNDPKRAFSELPARGAVLIGFDVGVGKFGKIETVYALRPLYLTAEGEESYQEYGLFADRRLPNNKVLKSKVTKKVRIEAEPGYAVSGVTLRTGLNINGLSVTFMKIKGRTLDPNRTYTSEWVGDRTGGGEASISGDGAPVIGVFGCQDDEHVYGLGLLYAEPLPVPRPPPEPPRTEKPVTLERLEKPAATPAKRAPAAEPPADPADNDWPPAPPAADDTLEPEPATPGPEAWTLWLPYAVFGVVVMLVLGVSLLFYSATRRPPPRPRKVTKRVPTLEPADAVPNPPDVPTLALAEAVNAAGPAPTAETQAGICTSLPVAPPPVPQKPPSPSRRVLLGGSFLCPSCARPVVNEAGMPPWCPHCGSSLSGTPGENESRVPPAPMEREDRSWRAAARDDKSRLFQPPYFHARSDRTYRIYILEDELLFLDAPAMEDRSGAENIVRGLAPMGGLIGGLVGATICEAMAAGRKGEVMRRRHELERADTEELKEMADCERTSFRAEVAGLSEVSIAALGFWERLFSEGAAGRLNFYHRDRGRMTLVLPTPSDMRTAIEKLTTVLGEKLTVNAAWDYGNNRYVPKS